MLAGNSRKRKEKNVEAYAMQTRSQKQTAAAATDSETSLPALSDEEQRRLLDLDSLVDASTTPNEPVVNEGYDVAQEEVRADSENQYNKMVAEIDEKIMMPLTKHQNVGEEGGSMENSGCNVTFPPNTFSRAAEVETSVITDLSDCHQGRTVAAPIIECKTSRNMNKLAHVEVESWVIPGTNIQIFWKESKKCEWKPFKRVRVEDDGNISFYTEHFCFFLFEVFDAAIDIVYRFARWIWSWFELPFKTVRIQNPVYIHGARRLILCICHLSSAKVRDDVTKSLGTYGFQLLLPPECRRVRSTSKINVTVACAEPRNLVIFPTQGTLGNRRTAITSHKAFSVSTVRNDCYEFLYFPLALVNGDLKTYTGMLRANYVFNPGENKIERPLCTEWPIPASPTPVINVHNYHGEITDNKVVNQLLQ